MRPEDFALMELEAELKAEAVKRKRTEKKQKNIGYVFLYSFSRFYLQLLPLGIFIFRCKTLFSNTSCLISPQLNVM